MAEALADLDRQAEANRRGERVVVIDDHRLLVQMLVEHLASRGFDALALDVLETDLVARLRALEPAVLLLDAVFDDDEEGGMRILRALLDDDGDGRCETRVIVLTGVTDPIRHAEFLDAGAAAIIAKADSFSGVIARVEDVIAGRDPVGINRRQELAHRLAEHRASVGVAEGALRCLTTREHATLQALVDGFTVDEIAAKRTVAVSTVRSQVRAVLRKLGVRSQIEAVAAGARLGLRPSVGEG